MLSLAVYDNVIKLSKDQVTKVEDEMENAVNKGLDTINQSDYECHLVDIKKPTEVKIKCKYVKNYLPFSKLRLLD